MKIALRPVLLGIAAIATPIAPIVPARASIEPKEERVKLNSCSIITPVGPAGIGARRSYFDGGQISDFTKARIAPTGSTGDVVYALRMLEYRDGSDIPSAASLIVIVKTDRKPDRRID